MMKPTRPFRTALAVAAGLSLLLAACGDDGDADSPSETDAAASDSAAAESTEDGDTGDAVDFAAILESAPVADELPEDSPTLQAVSERGTLKIGGSLDAPLLSQQDPATGEVTGLDAYFGQLLATYILGEPSTEIVNSATETREALLQNGTVDVVFQTYTITPERAEQVAFAGPYYESGLAILAPADTDITVPEDLDGRTVIAGANTPAIPAIEEVAPSAEIVTFGTSPEALEALRQGRGEAYVQDMAILVGDAERYPELQVVGEPFTVDPYGIGLPMDDPAMKDFVNEWLELIEEEGIWADVWEASFGQVVAGDAPEPPAIGSAEGS